MMLITLDNGVVVQVFRSAARKLMPGRQYVMVYGNNHSNTVIKVEFIGETVDIDQEKRREFKEIGDNETFEAYKYNNRWCVGSSAEPCSLYLIPNERELALHKAKQIDKGIKVKQDLIDSFKRQIQKLTERIAKIEVESHELRIQKRTLLLSIQAEQ